MILTIRTFGLMNKIDAHTHVNFSGFDLEKLINYLNDKQIEKCWLLSWEEKKPVFPDLYQHLDVETILEAYQKHPDRIVPFYAPDPGRDDLEKVLKVAKEKGLKGCGELKVSYLWSDPEIENLLNILHRLDLPLLFHMEQSFNRFIASPPNPVNKLLNDLLNGALRGKTRKISQKFIDKTGLFRKYFYSRLSHFPGYLPDFEGLEQRLQQFPDVNFIAHGPDTWKHIEKDPDPFISFARGRIKAKGKMVILLEKYDNLYTDISGKSGFYALKRDPAFTREFLNKNYRKILFGTDNFDQLPFDEVLQNSGIGKEKLEYIYHLNAESLCK